MQKGACREGGGWLRYARLERDDEERACRRALDPEVAGALLRALGVDGFVRVKQCWVWHVPGLPRRQAVLVETAERWRVAGEDTGVAVERVYYLRAGEGGWYVDGTCRALPNELGEVFDRVPSPRGRTVLKSLELEAYEAALAEAGLGRGEVPQYSRESPEWYGMHVDRVRRA